MNGKENPLTQGGGILNGSQLKLIALLAMTCDHVGKQLLPQYELLQIIGRLAYPVFAYMIAEGCRYTRKKGRYLGNMAVLAFLCQMVYYVAMQSLYQCILVTFTVSIVLIYSLDAAKRTRSAVSVLLAAAALLGVYLFSVALPEALTHTDYAIDYGIWGILLPAAVYLAEKKPVKLLAAAVCLFFLGMEYGGIQWYAFLALPLLALYDGTVGKRRLKYLFYIYYPLHLACIYLLRRILTEI